MLTNLTMSSLRIVCTVGLFFVCFPQQPKVALLPNMRKNKVYVFIVEVSGS